MVQIIHQLYENTVQVTYTVTGTQTAVSMSKSAWIQIIWRDVFEVFTHPHSEGLFLCFVWGKFYAFPAWKLNPWNAWTDKMHTLNAIYVNFA